MTIRPITLTICSKILIFRPKILTIRSKILTIAFCGCTDRPHRHGKHHRTMTASSRRNDSSFRMLDNTRRPTQELRVGLTGDVGVEHPGGKDHASFEALLWRLSSFNATKCLVTRATRFCRGYDSDTKTGHVGHLESCNF